MHTNDMFGKNGGRAEGWKGGGIDFPSPRREILFTSCIFDKNDGKKNN